MDGASSSSSSNTGRWTYDVFLCFRGEDTRNNFVDHLYEALDRAGIYTFKDDEKLQRGKSISPELLKAIQQSMVAIVVFSKNFASSSWCLEELVKIIECRHMMGQRVLPVFYGVDPSDVRGQKKSFHEAFQQHQVKFIDNVEKIKRWREALRIAANLSGWDVPKTASGREAECVKKIVRTILRYTQSHPVENLIGMESRIRDVKSLLGKGCSDVCIIGIWGMGGLGKTTIARAVYHQISDEFEGSCFVEDVRENGSDKGGLKSIQEKLLSEILRQKDYKVKDCDDGVSQIQKRLGRKKILVVLDDVDNMQQLDFLAGAHEWFGPGSRIIVTTRDEHLLSNAQQKYAPKLLRETEAMKLFSRYAFKANNPSRGFEKLSSVVVSHTGHLPLALKVLGSYFSGRNLDFWRSGLNVLAKIPNKEINGILKLSFNGLNILEKRIFVYIACFYKGRERSDVTRILDSLGFEAVSGITVLIEKSLLTILDGRLHMHDLIQEMGLCIVSECYPNTMLWVPEQIKEVMTSIPASPFHLLYSNCFGPSSSFVSETDCKRLEAIEAIVETKNNVYRYSSKVLKRMKNLRLLQVRGRFISSKSKYFPEELRWLCWSRYPFKSLRLAKSVAKLVGLQMTNSSIHQVQIEKKVILTNLKFMDLRYSSSLTSFPDITEVPNLESLNLSYCESLVEVHQSVLHHERIIHLNLSECCRLKTLPPSINMKSLQALDLHGCKNLKRFPEVSTEMERLLLLNTDRCDKIFPDIRLFIGLIVFVSSSSYSINTLTNRQCMQGFTDLTSLRILDVEQNYLVEKDFPGDLHKAWPSLEELNLRKNIFTWLPASISQLSHLKYINLSNCVNLKELHKLPSRIQVLKSDHCKSLLKIGDLSNKYKWLFKISLHDCPELLKYQESRSHIANLLRKSFVKKCAAVNHRLSILVPGSKIPKWFNNQRSGNKIPLNLPQKQINKIVGLAVCCHLCQSPDMPIHLRIKFEVSSTERLIDIPTRTATTADHVLWIGYMPIDITQNLCHGFESGDLIISDKLGLTNIVKCGVFVVYKDDIKPMTETGSWIRDYDESDCIDHDNASIEDLQNGRWSLPTFSHKTTGGREVHVRV